MTRSCALTSSRIAARSSISLWAVLLGMVVMWGGCRPKDAPVVSGPFTDTFDRAELGSDWRDTGGDYRLVEGKMVARNAYNHPAWLRKRLPPDVSVQMDVQSKSAAGDIKIEIFGDGESFDPDRGGYVSSGYVLIFGGWNNTLSVICRNNEHDDGRKVSRSDRRVEAGRTYHFEITRKGAHIDWRVDGAPFLAWTDPSPLAGRGHEYLAVNDWEAEVLFDNISIVPAR
ncbi:MAG: hypothetical protein H7X95_09700 [Deltaproteobacteria bacterium]|nr:hypothetical protein [Deltaproteobacteria bacterium]